MTSPKVLIGRAAGHYASGNLKTAANLCRRVLKEWPRNADALHLLGVVTYKAGDSRRAARYLKDALAQGRADPEIYRNLGFALRDSGDPAGAAHSYREVLALTPGDPVSHFQLGVIFAERDEAEQAVWYFDQVLLHDPENSFAQYNRAKALLALSRITEAERGYASASRLLATDYRVYAGWGMALSILERPEEARRKFVLALEQEPPPPITTDLLAGIGGTYHDQGGLDEARAKYEAARERDPTHPDAAAGLAAVYDRERDYQGSYDLIRPFSAENPPNVSVVVAFARVAPHFGEAEKAVERLEAAFAQDSLLPHQNRRLHFALGKLRDSVGEWDAAFQDYRLANELYGDSHDPEVYTQITDQKIKAFGQADAARLRLRKSPSELPVFILGMPRSGTSLVEQILSCHPRVAGGGELFTLPNIVGGLPGQLGIEADYRSLIGRIDPGTVETAARTYVEALRAVDPGAARVTDKLPHNFEHLWLIAAAFPGAPIIHCTRHPLDTCLSCYFQDFAGRHAYSRNLTHLGRHYADYRRLMGHWRDTLDLNMMEVAYEDVVRDTEVLSRKIVAFCGLDWDPACLEFHENRRYVGTASFDQVRRPIYARSVGRYRHYERHTGELKDALQVAAT